MKKKRTLIVLVALLLVVGISSYTYAKYTGSSNGTGTTTAAAFTVKVNDKDLGEAVDFTVTPSHTSGSTYVADDKVAPGFGGYFDVVIDPTGSEVALNYTISDLKLSDGTSTLTNVSLDKYEVIANGAQAQGYDAATTVNNSTISDSIMLTNGQTLTENNKITVRVYFTWEGYVDDDTDKTDTSLAGKVITVSGTVKVDQKYN